MGADFLVLYINKIDENKLVDFEAIKNGIEDKEYRYDEGESSCDQDAMIKIVEDLELAWNNELRDASRIKIHGKETLITGGMSWGDSPTNTWANIEIILNFPDLLKLGNLE